MVAHTFVKFVNSSVDTGVVVPGGVNFARELGCVRLVVVIGIEKKFRYADDRVDVSRMCEPFKNTWYVFRGQVSP